MCIKEGFLEQLNRNLSSCDLPVGVVKFFEKNYFKYLEKRKYADIIHLLYEVSNMAVY